MVQDSLSELPSYSAAGKKHFLFLNLGNHLNGPAGIGGERLFKRGNWSKRCVCSIRGLVMLSWPESLLIPEAHRIPSFLSPPCPLVSQVTRQLVSKPWTLAWQWGCFPPPNLLLSLRHWCSHCRLCLFSLLTYYFLKFN